PDSSVINTPPLHDALPISQDIVQRYTAWESLSRQKNSIKIGVSIRQSQTAIEALRQEAPDFSPSRYIFIETTHQERENMVESGEDRKSTRLNSSHVSISYP